MVKEHFYIDQQKNLAPVLAVSSVSNDGHLQNPLSFQSIPKYIRTFDIPVRKIHIGFLLCFISVCQF